MHCITTEEKIKDWPSGHLLTALKMGQILPGTNGGGLLRLP